MKKEENELGTLERELESLQNAKSKLEKSIVDENNKIVEYNDKTEILKQDAKNLNEQIGQEKSILIGLEDEEAKKAEIKNIEKVKEQSLKDVETLQMKIVESNSAIDRARLEIESNLRDQSAKVAEIDKQKQAVNTAEQKLNNIINYRLQRLTLISIKYRFLYSLGFS